MKIESKKMDMMERINLTRLNAPLAKNGSPKATVFIVLCKSDREPPVKSRRTLANDHPTVLFLFQLRYT